MVEKIVIIGSGPAGLSAAIYSAREGFEPLVLGGSKFISQLTLTTLVENIPGFPEGVLGPDFVELLKKQALKFGARIQEKDVIKVDLSSRPFKIFAEDKSYEAQALIIATGANARSLGIESEKKFIGRGVSYCATCDGAFFKGKNVFVVGGGDTAMQDALFLTRFANSVTIVHRRDSFRSCRILQERVLSNPKIKVLWNSTVSEIKGDAKMTAVVIKNAVTGQSQTLPAEGIFVAVGYEPNSKLFEGQLKLDEQHHLVAKDSVKTEVEGVFVAGDVADRKYRQAAIACGSGIKAAIEARTYLSNL